MGARTQLSLCPPGNVRRDLQTALRQRTRSHSAKKFSLESGGYYGLDKLVGQDAAQNYDLQESDYLRSTNAYDNDSEEEASSGDEDEMRPLNDMFSEDPPPLDDQDVYVNLREPLFVAAGAESALSNPNGAPMSSMGRAHGRLPFNRRKIRYFDGVTADDTAFARAYLRKEMNRSKKREAVLLSRHLRKLQVEQRRRRRIERGEPIDDLKNADRDTPEEKALLNNGVERFKPPMTPTASAALVLESLSVNPVESVEGMAKCYDGIVAAGVALLDNQAINPTSLSTNKSKARPLRSQIMAALAPLLITSLEQPSGEVILMLAKLRRMCGTARYQRRFVQRVAPRLIRPPRAAMWSLRHQNDMEAILAAAELIFDAAFDVFSKGWHERGRLLLADSKRAETLNSAAKQLRRLSSGASDGLSLALPGHGSRRRYLTSHARKGDGVGGSGDALAEWEVIAVDKQIRISISNVFSSDWSRAVAHADIPRPLRRASVTATAKRIATLPQTSSSEMSPKSLSSSPRSPARSWNKTPQSPLHIPGLPPSNATDSIDNVFGSSFNAQSGFQSDRERAVSPPPTPHGLSSLQRSNSKELDSKGPITPPRSPKSPSRAAAVDPFRKTEPPAVLAPLSPRRGKSGAMKEVVGVTPPGSLTPLSPSASSVGTSGSGDVVTYKPTLSNAAAAPGSSTSHYRMLTSTASERKRTVAACRALRAQIQRFEDAFIQLHGRSPKGASERAPLATTYAQYREWKRAIRADAACRIQALFRGSSTRWRLLRLNNPKISRVIMKKAGRSKGNENVINKISIPVEIGQSDRNLNAGVGPAPIPESFSGHGQPLAPQWASKIVRRRNSGDRDDFPVVAPPRQFPSPVAPALSPASVSDLNSLSLSELQARKRDLKQQLKQYDMNFARRHGRMPVKAEKEPIRHLYESYNALKGQITQMEQEGRSLPTSPPSPVPSPIAVVPQRTVSPPSGSESGPSSGGDDSPLRPSPMSARGKRKLPKAASPPLVAPSAPAPSQDLASLKAEKTQLHQMLRAYEKDFFRDHRRQVSSFADIRPVANQYRRYKEIKKAIASLQEEKS